MEQNTRRQASHTRWWIALMGTMIMLTNGSVSAWSYFQQPVMAVGNWTNAQAVWTYSLAILCIGIAGAWGGVNYSRFQPRRLVMTGGTLLGGGYMLAGYALYCQSLPLLYIGYGLSGGIGIGLCYVAPVATVAKWFPERKGFSTGLVIMGFGFGAIFMAKILAPAFMMLTDGDLIMVFAFIGLVLLVISVPAGYCLVDPPAGFAPAGRIAQAADAGKETSGDDLTARRCILSGKFLMMWAVFFINNIVGIMFISFQSPLLQDLLKKTLDPATLSDPKVVAGLAAAGATLIGVSSVFNGVGRIFWGWLSDRIGRVQTFRLILGSQLAVFMALVFVENPIIFGICVSYVLMCFGGGFGAMPSFVLDVFGQRMMPVVYGMILTAWSGGGVVGPQVVAFFKDNFAGEAAEYTFVSAAALLLVGLIIAFVLNNRELAPAVGAIDRRRGHAEEWDTVS